MGQSDAVDLLHLTAIVRVKMDECMGLVDALQHIKHLVIVDIVQPFEILGKHADVSRTVNLNHKLLDPFHKTVESGHHAKFVAFDVYLHKNIMIGFHVFMEIGEIVSIGVTKVLLHKGDLRIVVGQVGDCSIKCITRRIRV